MNDLFKRIAGGAALVAMLAIPVALVSASSASAHEPCAAVNGQSLGHAEVPAGHSASTPTGEEDGHRCLSPQYAQTAVTSKVVPYTAAAVVVFVFLASLGFSLIVVRIAIMKGFRKLTAMIGGG